MLWETTIEGSARLWPYAAWPPLPAELTRTALAIGSRFLLSDRGITFEDAIATSYPSPCTFCHVSPAISVLSNSGVSSLLAMS